MKSNEERDADRRAAGEEAYREVFEVEHRDPFGPLFKFPDWVPSFFVFLHRRCLRRLRKDYSLDTLRTVYAHYKAQLGGDHAELREAGGLLPPTMDDFRDLAHILWALELGKAEGEEAALGALLGDPEEVRFWQQGRKNVSAVKSGGAARRAKFEPIRQAESVKFCEAATQYRLKYPARNFTAACADIARRSKCSESHVRAVLKSAKITALSYQAIKA